MTGSLVPHDRVADIADIFARAWVRKTLTCTSAVYESQACDVGELPRGESDLLPSSECAAGAAQKVDVEWAENEQQPRASCGTRTARSRANNTRIAAGGAGS